ncbi:hypothetical protein DSM104299_03201 [Baekduia alba]|nr:hypothetical protein DSM104299_03201 [Baekduia alba]
MADNRVMDGPACRGCGLPNYQGLCPVCRGDEAEAREENMPYPWDDEPYRDLEDRS